MKVSKIDFYRYEKDKLMGFCTLTFDESLVIKGFKVMKSDKGYFLAMPSMKGKDGQYYDTVFFTNKEMRQEIERMVLAKAGVQNEVYEDTTVYEDDLPF